MRISKKLLDVDMNTIKEVFIYCQVFKFQASLPGLAHLPIKNNT